MGHKVLEGQGVESEVWVVRGRVGNHSKKKKEKTNDNKRTNYTKQTIKLTLFSIRVTSEPVYYSSSAIKKQSLAGHEA